MAMRGITFENQLVTQKDDGVLYNWMVGRDGFMTGCELSYSGMDLTIAPGYLCVAGRILKVVTSETVTLDTEVTDGYARLKLTIDTSKLSSETEFEQVELSWDYSGTTSFPALTQEAINDDGVIYDFVVCIVSTTTGGITGIVQQANNLNGVSRPTLLWSGSWSSGNITVPGSADFKEFNIVITQSSMVIKATRNEGSGNAIYGINGSMASSGTVVSSFHFACTVSGDVWAWQNAGSLNHTGSSNHGAVNVYPVTAIYGVV